MIFQLKFFSASMRAKHFSCLSILSLQFVLASTQNMPLTQQKGRDSSNRLCYVDLTLQVTISTNNPLWHFCPLGFVTFILFTAIGCKFRLLLAWYSPVLEMNSEWKKYAVSQISGNCGCHLWDIPAILWRYTCYELKNSVNFWRLQYRLHFESYFVVVIAYCLWKKTLFRLCKTKSKQTVLKSADCAKSFRGQNLLLLLYFKVITDANSKLLALNGTSYSRVQLIIRYLDRKGNSMSLPKASNPNRSRTSLF